MNSINVFHRTSIVVRLSTSKQLSKYFIKQKSTNSKKHELKDKIKMKTPIGKVLRIIFS